MLKKTDNATRLLELAVKLAGTAEAVREALKCSLAELDYWRSGAAEPPPAEYHRLIDLIISEQAKQIRGYREALARLKHGES